MIKLERLVHTYEMLEDLDGFEVCLKDIKNRKQESEYSTLTIERLKRKGVLRKTREEEIILKFDKPITTITTFVNGQPLKKELKGREINYLKSFGCVVETKEQEITELPVKKGYYKVDISKLRCLSDGYILALIDKRENEIDILKKLLTM